MNSITGKIIDKLSELPVYEAVVLLKKTNSSTIDIAQLSNVNGEFKWLEVEVGKYSLKIVTEKYKTQTLYFKCEMNSTIDLVILLEKN